MDYIEPFGFGNIAIDNDRHENVMGVGGFVAMGTRYDKAFDMEQIFAQRAREYELLKPHVHSAANDKNIDISNVTFHDLRMDTIQNNIQQYKTVLQTYNDKKKEYDAFCEKIVAMESLFEKYKNVNTETYNMLHTYKQYIPMGVENTYNNIYIAVLQELHETRNKMKQTLDGLHSLKKKGFDVINAVHNVCNEINVQGDDLKHPCSVCMSHEVDSCLPCGHTFCSGCILQTEQSTRQKKCSACRVSYQRAIKLYY